MLLQAYQTLCFSFSALRPPVILGLSNQTVDQDKVSETALFCNVTGNPYPKVRWLSNGEPIRKVLVRPSCDKQQKGYYYKNKEHTVLTICEVDTTHTGLYTCVVGNQLGNDSRDVYLNVIGKFETYR